MNSFERSFRHTPGIGWEVSSDGVSWVFVGHALMRDKLAWEVFRASLLCSVPDAASGIRVRIFAHIERAR